MVTTIEIKGPGGTCKGRQKSSGGFIWKYKEI
jgi:hypothetical protein